MAGTTPLTPNGEKPIETFRIGDEILSRSEYDPDGPLAVQIVEETFVRTAPILALQVDGREIKTTAQHPFFTKSKGWICDQA